jgi:hypothetical protein
MDSSSEDDHIRWFVLELLRTGCVLTDLVADLIEALPAGAYPGEEPASVVIEMLCGTIATALVSADPGDVRRATELIYVAATRTREHLRLACDLSRRIHGDDGGIGRAYG